MKKIIKHVGLVLVVLPLLWSCKEDDEPLLQQVDVQFQFVIKNITSSCQSETSYDILLNNQESYNLMNGEEEILSTRDVNHGDEVNVKVYDPVTDLLVAEANIPFIFTNESEEDLDGVNQLFIDYDHCITNGIRWLYVF